MKKKFQQIKKRVELPKSQDFEFLKRQGIQYIEQLSGDIWTDYNIHDPGITVLEQLCYAMTELGHKASLDIRNFLFDRNQVKKQNQDYCFYEAPEILTCAPVTKDDYRKFLLDRIQDIDNIWMIPRKQSRVGHSLVGLYDLYIATKQKKDWKRIKREVLKLLTTNRNLGEDFVDIHFLEPVPITIRGIIEIDPNTYVESVIANMFH